MRRSAIVTSAAFMLTTLTTGVSAQCRARTGPTHHARRQRGIQIF
jgi:hypothetical protein